MNEADHNAALATIEYLKEQVHTYQEQLHKRDSYYTIKVTGNYWVYGSQKATQALQDILFEHARMKYGNKGTENVCTETLSRSRDLE